jgi:phosphoesterase RecJ-like protein
VAKSSLPAAARAVARELRRARRALISSHVRPDGDAVGSALALAWILRARGRKADVVLPDPVPRQYRFLKGAGSVRRPAGLRPRRYDAHFALDTAAPERLGAASEALGEGWRTVVIDHHPSNTRFGEVNWVDPGASSVGEMLYKLAGSMRWPIPPAARDCLYTAIVTDTGRFTFGNTTAEAMAAASALVGAGADPERIADSVWGGRSRGDWELEVRARASLRLEAGGRIATIELSARDFEETGAGPAAAQDLASLTRQLEGVEMALFFYELDGPVRTKVGVRSSRGVDASRFAGSFGGGGHRQAAGFEVEGRIAGARGRVLAAAKRFLSGSARGRGRRRR